MVDVTSNLTGVSGTGTTATAGTANDGSGGAGSGAATAAIPTGTAAGVTAAAGSASQAGTAAPASGATTTGAVSLVSELTADEASISDLTSKVNELTGVINSMQAQMTTAANTSGNAVTPAQFNAFVNRIMGSGSGYNA